MNPWTVCVLLCVALQSFCLLANETDLPSVAPKQDCRYIRIGATSVNPYQSAYPIPDISIGTRYASGMSAVDFSVSVAFGYDDSVENAPETRFLVNLPKLQIIRYLPLAHLYCGGGLGLTLLSDSPTQTSFFGVSTNMLAGIQFSPTGRWQHGAQIECIQPALPFINAMSSLLPAITLTYSFGF